MTFKERLIKLDYPDNHHYDPDTLEPLDIMKKRVELLKINAPELLAGGRSLLDIGSNKGFISFYLRNIYSVIYSIEPLKQYVDFCNDLQQHHGIININFIYGNFEDIHGNFEDTSITPRFSVLFVGNVSHYLFRNCVRKHEDSFGWLRRIVSFTENYVILDGPLDYHEFAIRGMAKDEGWDVGIISRYTLDNMKKVLSGEGFAFVRIGYNGIGVGNSARRTAVFKRQ